MKYSSQLLHYFHHREHAGCLDSRDAGVYHAQVGSVENREVLSLWVHYQSRIEEARFQAAGSVPLIAGGEWLCGWLEHKTPDDLSQLTPESILKALDLTALHIHTAHLIFLAVYTVSRDMA
jgi:NifU-like protein involved in Fe-S cluster formation